jgi:predicted DNA-binding transcriptional regulator AlpA
MSIEHHPQRQRGARLLRFADLKALGIVKNRVTLSRWVQGQGFPSGFLIGANTRVWRESDIEQWLAERERSAA